MQRKTHVVSQERCTTVELQTVWCNILPQLSIKLQVALVDRGRNQAIIVSPFWSLAWEHCSAATCCCKGVTNSIENAFLLPVPSLFATTNWTNQCWIGNLTYSLFILGEVWCTDAWAKLLVTCTYSHCFVVGWAVCECLLGEKWCGEVSSCSPELIRLETFSFCMNMNGSWLDENPWYVIKYLVKFNLVYLWLKHRTLV